MRLAFLLSGLTVLGCPMAAQPTSGDLSEGTDGGFSYPGPSSIDCGPDAPYATEVVSFSPGSEAGYGQEKMPDVVLGPPLPGSPQNGSLDVLSLGHGGTVVLGFGERVLIDGPGVDFVIWENVFWIDGDPTAPFAELGTVAVSEDGEAWLAFPCDPDLSDGYDTGCAGWRPRAEFEVCADFPLDPEQTGGDGFDLAEIGLASARYIKITDASFLGDAPSAGFDLDAVGLVNWE